MTEKIEILFAWTAQGGEIRNHTIQSCMIPRVGETVDLGYISEYGYVEKVVKNVTYVFNTNYVKIELSYG